MEKVRGEKTFVRLTVTYEKAENNTGVTQKVRTFTR